MLGTMKTTLFIVYLFCAWLFIPTNSHAQDVFEDLLPLSLGNQWSFVLPNQDPTTNPYRYEINVVGQFSDNDDMFYILDQPLPCLRIDTLITDRSGKVFAKQGVAKSLLFDFEQQNDDQRTFNSHIGPSFEYEIVTERTHIITAGPFRGRPNVSIYFNDPRSLDEESRFWFLPEIGFAAIQCGWSFIVLQSARVSGVIVTNVEREGIPNQATIQFNAFPNPFVNQLTIEYETTDLVRIEVIDMLGRTFHSSGNHINSVISDHVKLNTNGLSAGVYLVRLTDSNGTTTSRIVTKNDS